MGTEGMKCNVLFEFLEEKSYKKLSLTRHEFNIAHWFEIQIYC